MVENNLSTIEQLKRDYPIGFQRYLDKGFNEYQILKMFLIEQEEKKYFQENNIGEIYIREDRRKE